MTPETVSTGADSEIRLSIRSRMENVFLVGLAIHAYARQIGFVPADAGLMELAVVEAVNNAIEHACAGRPDRVVEVQVTVRPQWFEVLVACIGGHIPCVSRKETVAQPSLCRADLPVGGRGMAIIERIMDEVCFDLKGDRQVLTMRKQRPAKT